MEDYKKLIADCQDYVKTRYDLLRLELLDKLSQIIGIIVLVIVALFIVMGALAYFSVALVHAMAHIMPTGVACVILGGILLVILLVLYMNKERVFINPFVKILSGLLFAEQQETEEQDKPKEVKNERIESDK